MKFFQKSRRTITNQTNLYIKIFLKNTGQIHEYFKKKKIYKKCLNKNTF